MADNYSDIAKGIITVVKDKDLDFSKVYQNCLNELLQAKDIATLKETLKAVESFLSEKEAVLKSLKVVTLTYNNLTEAELAEIKIKIKAKYGENCVIDEIQDDKLVWGFKIEVDSDLLDNSLANKLHKINISVA